MVPEELLVALGSFAKTPNGKVILYTIFHVTP
jgi:hypothetical protein